MPRGRHRQSSPLSRLLPPTACGVLAIASLISAVFTADPVVLRTLVVAASVGAFAGAVLLRLREHAGEVDLEAEIAARARDEARFEDRAAELEAAAESAEEQVKRLERRLLAQRAQITRIESENARLLRDRARMAAEQAAREAEEIRRREVAARGSRPSPTAYLKAAAALRGLERRAAVGQAQRIAAQAGSAQAGGAQQGGAQAGGAQAGGVQQGAAQRGGARQGGVQLTVGQQGSRQEKSGPVPGAVPKAPAVSVMPAAPAAQAAATVTSAVPAAHAAQAAQPGSAATAAPAAHAGSDAASAVSAASGASGSAASGSPVGAAPAGATALGGARGQLPSALDALVASTGAGASAARQHPGQETATAAPEPAPQAQPAPAWARAALPPMRPASAVLPTSVVRPTRQSRDLLRKDAGSGGTFNFFSRQEAAISRGLGDLADVVGDEAAAAQQLYAGDPVAAEAAVGGTPDPVHDLTADDETEPIDVRALRAI